ncbi:MAG: LptF/LptG family permease [Acidobacteria bacterium]|nr:LptF/LptG family permease [Acidobacteriota bacterium]
MNGVKTELTGRQQLFRLPSPTLTVYLLRELIVPTLIGFGLFTFFLLMNYLLTLAELILRDGVGVGDVGRLFLYSVPHTIVLTVPMAVLVGGLVAFGRLSADAEIIAMRSGGFSLYQLAAPILIVGLAATLLNVYLCLQILPWGNNEIVQLRWRLVNSRTIAGQIRPRVFETRFPNFTLYVGDVVGPEQRWEELLLVRTDQNPPRVIMAESAQLQFDEESRGAWLELTNGYSYEGGDTAEQSTVITFRAQGELLRDESGFSAIAPVQKDERMMQVGELNAKIKELELAGLPAEKYRVEVHKKFAIPMACLVMALIALPLGVSTKRHTKATGYLIAIGVIAVYYQLIENGEKFAEEGAIPVWLGMWTADIVIGGAALLLLWGKAREKDFGVLDRALKGVNWCSEQASEVWHTWRGEAPASERSETISSIAGGRRFPRLLDQMVLTQFARIFAMTLLGLVVLWLIGEYLERADDVYSAGVSRWVILEYLAFQLPFILTMTIPIATILTVLIVFSLMSKYNEVVGVLAGGTSIFRLAAPVLIPVLLLTLMQYAICDYIVPYTNQRVAKIKVLLQLTRSNPDFVPAQGHWVRGQGRYIFNYADYDAKQMTFQGLRVYYLDEEEWRLARVDYAARVRWENGQWVGTDSWRRHYVYDSENRVSSPELARMATTILPIEEGPEYFETEQRLPEQMSAYELRQHITNLETRGFDAGRYKMDLQQKFAFPVIVFVLAVVGIPFGFRMGRQGTLSGIGVALGLTMLFWLTFVFFRAVGSAEMLPPLIAAWAPHVLFLALAGYVTVGLRT